MGKESKKAYDRRVREGDFDKIFFGSGIDISSGDDPVTPDCRNWDVGDGDAQELLGV